MVGKAKPASPSGAKSATQAKSTKAKATSSTPRSRKPAGPSADQLHQLQQSQALLEQVSTAVMLVDNSFVVQYVNKATTNLFAQHAGSFQTQYPGFNPAELVGQNLAQVGLLSDQLRQQLAETRDRTIEVEVPIGKLTLQVRIAQQVDADGQTTGISLEWSDVTTTRDIVGQVQAIGKSQAVIEFDLTGTILTANDNFLAAVGYTLDEIRGKHHSMFAEPAYAASDEYREFWESLNRGQYGTGEYKRFGKGGKEIWIQASYNPIFDRNGKPFKVVKYATDVTAAKFRNADYEGQLAAISKAQATIEFDLEGRIVTANENFLETLGYTLEEIRGNHHSMFVDPAYANSAEYRQFWAELKAGVYKNAEYKRLGKGGKEVWIQASYNPILDVNGKPCKVVKFATDVTATKIKNADYEGQLAAINKAQATIEFDLDGRIVTANENFLSTLGYSLAEVQGKHHSMFVDAAYANSAEYRQFWADLKAGVYQAAQYKRFGKGGKEIWIQASYNPIFDLNGKPYKVVKYATDITAAKNMEFEIAERQKADAQTAAELQANVTQILEVANRVSHGDYSVEITVAGDDAVGQLGLGLRKFFADKKVAEAAERERNDREREEAELQRQKVEQVLHVVNAVAEGNFDIDVPDLGNDAVGQVAKALDAAVESIREALLEVSTVAETVSSAASQLEVASSEISKGAQNQASSLEETASSLEEITSTVKQNTDNAQQARQLANGSRDVAEKGGEVVGDAVKAMGEINHASTKIADIITTIDEIAFQTNLLALNAAVEAARAGEQGRGFAVVAAEVRNLAQRSASAAKEIKSLIQDSVRKVENGTSLVNQSGKTLEEIVSSVKRVTDIVAEIAAASKEQLAGIEQVNKAVAQMDRVTQNNASQTEEMSGTAAALLQHSNQLRDAVDRFELGEEEPVVQKPTKRRGAKNTTRQQQASSSGKRSSGRSVEANLDEVTDQIDELVGSGFLEF